MTRLSRRVWLKHSAGLIVLLGLTPSACAPASAPAPSKPAETKPAAAPTAAKPAEAKPAESKPAAPAQAAPAKAPAGPSKPVAIEYWHINSESFGLPAIREQIAAFSQKYPNIRVEERNQPGNYAGLMQNLQAALAAKNPPAVAQIGHNFLGYVSENIPYTPVEEFTGSEPEFIKNYTENILDLGRYKGKLVGMPLSLSSPVMYVNADLLKAAGLESEKLPTTFDESRAAARTVKDKTGKFGIWIQSYAGDYWNIQALIQSNGGRLLSEDRTQVVWDGPEAVEAMQLHGDLAQSDRTLPVVTGDEGHQSFMNGDIAMAITSIARLSGIAAASKFTLLTAKHPTFGTKPRKVPGGGNSLYVFATDPDQKAAAWEWIKFLAGPEGQTSWVKGTGYVPIRNGIADDPQYLKTYLDEKRQMRAALDQLPDVVPWAVFPGRNSLQIGQVLTDARDEILGGNRDAKSALTEAAAKANALIRQ